MPRYFSKTHQRLIVSVALMKEEQAVRKSQHPLKKSVPMEVVVVIKMILERNIRQAIRSLTIALKA